MRNIIKCVRTKMSIAYLFIIILVACGCQPTPENTAVVYGGDIEDKINSTSISFEEYNVPMNLQEVLDFKGGRIEINASISVPDVTAIPVYKVKSAGFDDKINKSLVNYFVKGNEVIKYTEPTKADLERLLILAKKNNDQELEAEYRKMIDTAPDTVEIEKITDWSTDQATEGCFIKENGECAGIRVGTDTFLYMNGFIMTESVALLNDEEIGEISISEEDAKAAARDTLHELGIDYMVADSLEKAQRYACLSTSSYAEYSENPVSKGYFIQFARNVDGIAAIIDNGVSFNVADEFDYKAPFSPEEIQIFVDEEGIIQSFVWLNPLSIEDTLSDNVSLLSFEDVKKRISDMLIFINSYNSAPTEVTSIALHMVIINVKDHLEEAMYVPAWFINYTKSYDEMQKEYTLVLNAIDGGRVLELPADLSSEMQTLMDKDV